MKRGEMVDYITTTHYSGLTLHRKCPQAWEYRYGMGLRMPKEGPATELHFGSWWGALRNAEALERGRRLGSLLGKPRSFGVVDGVRFEMATVTMRDVIVAANAWWKGLTPEAVEQWLDKLGEPLLPRLQSTYQRWEERWRDSIKYERPLGVEVFWKRALPRPEGDREWEQSPVNGPLDLFGENLPAGEELPRMELLGYIDELYEDTQRNITVVRDNKTAKELSVMGTSLDDMMDSQLQLYAWGIGPWCHEQGVARPTAVAYDRVKSVKPTSPRLTETTGKLSTATSRYDLRTYLEWAQQDTVTEAKLRWFQERGEIIEANEAYERAIEEETTAGVETPTALVKPEPVKALTDEQIAAIADLPAGRLYGKLGEFYVTGPHKGKGKFGVYQPDDAVIEHLTQPSWESQFRQRTLTPISPYVIRAHLRAAVDSATDIWRTQRRAEITLEAARNLSGSNCKFCDYRGLCRAQMVGGSEGTYDLREFKLVGPEGRLMLEEGKVVFGEVEAADSLIDA